MPVKSHCTFCYSTIYNASPLMLLGMEDVVKKLGPSALRLQFTTEGPGQVARCLRAYEAWGGVNWRRTFIGKEAGKGHFGPYVDL